MQPQSIDDLVDRHPLRAERDADEVELVCGDSRDGGAVRLVVIPREELIRVVGRRDAASHRAFVRSAHADTISLVDEHGLDEHRQVGHG
jgi:hypothetical protein